MDYIHDRVDSLIDELERELKKKYRETYKAIIEAVEANPDLFIVEDAKRKKRMSKRAYRAWQLAEIERNVEIHKLEGAMTARYVEARKTSQAILSGYLIKAYVESINHTAYEIEQRTLIDIKWTIYNGDTVKRLIKTHPQLLPKSEKVEREIAERKYKRWSQKKISRAVAESIVKGESMGELAKRFKTFTNMTTGAAIRNARTAMTGAENKGRLDAVEKAMEAGLELKKQWNATLDGRTRHEHRLLDGKVIGAKEEFDTGLEYPGDPHGKPEMVYNCRCAMKWVFNGLNPKKNLSLSPKLGGMSYEEWKRSKPVYAKKKKKR